MPRRTKRSVNDVALPMDMGSHATSTSGNTGDIELDKPKKKATPKKIKLNGRMTLPPFGDKMRKLITRIERSELDPDILLLQLGSTQWPISYKEHRELLQSRDIDFDHPDTGVLYERFLITLEAIITDEVSDAAPLYRIKRIAFEDSRAECSHQLISWMDAHGVMDTTLRGRIIRDACYPYVAAGEGVKRIGSWMVSRVTSWIDSLTDKRCRFLLDPNSTPDLKDERDRQVFDSGYRSKEWYDAMGIDP